jgi:8-oxo-dGTP pyrophosphatase MutT (NUDIX family)
LTAAAAPCYLENMNHKKDRDQNIVAAATIILTRERAGRLQVYLLKRSSKSGFMAGNFVFPGGTLDADDRNLNLFKNHIDLDLDEISNRFGEDIAAGQILAYCVAAIRETLEEAGVFLAESDRKFAENLAKACRLRLAAKPAIGWFANLVANDKWRLALSALSRWSHWITPQLMKRRFDTRFFLADMPANQFCKPDSRETVQGLWISPEEGLAGNMVGRIPLSPPTLVTLHELLNYPGLKELQTESSIRTWGQTILPRLVPLENGAVIVEPWDPMYREKEIAISPAMLPQAITPVGETFSRIWYDGRLWRPVRV